MSEDLPIIGGRWQLKHKIGAGAMGEVWAAHHVVTNQPAAVKLLHAHVGQDPRSVQRFTREVQAASTIDHPGIAAVYDGGRDPSGMLYIAMELLEGEALGDWLRWQRPNLTLVVRAFLRLLDALGASHAVGIIHRDIKPDNVFVLDGDANDRPVKLLDFGIARYEEGKQGATQTGLTVGTPYYMSPEQAVDPRTCGAPADIWSIGVMLYEVLAGRPPFTGETSTAVCLAAIQHPHEDLSQIAQSAPPLLLQLIDRCLEKRPENRYQTTHDLSVDLTAVLAELEDRSSAMPIARLAPRTGREPVVAAVDDLLTQDGARTTAGIVVEDGQSGRKRTALWIVLAIALISGGVTLYLLRDQGARGPSATTDAPRSVATAMPASQVPVTQPAIPATPITAAPITAAPVTAAPITAAPVTAAPVTAAPVTAAPDPVRPKVVRPKAPKTRAPRTRAPRPVAPRTVAPRTTAPVTAAPVTAAPVTAAPVTAAPVTAAPVTAAPVTAAPVAVSTKAPRSAAPQTKPAAPKSKAPKTDPFFTF